MFTLEMFGTDMLLEELIKLVRREADEQAMKLPASRKHFQVCMNLHVALVDYKELHSKPPPIPPPQKVISISSFRKK